MKITTKVIITSFLLIGLAVNYYKNTLIEKEFTSILEQKTTNNKFFIFSNIECSGLFSISCVINELSIKNNEISRITIEEFIINNIQDLKEFKELKDMKVANRNKLVIKYLKNGISLDIEIKNINIHFNDKHRKTEIRKKIVRKLSYDKDGKKIIEHLFNTLDRGGLNLSLKAEFTGAELFIKEMVSTNLSKSELSVNIEYEGSKLSDISSLEATSKDAIFKEIKFEIREKEDFFVSSLYIIYKRMANSLNKNDLDSINYINKQYLIKGDGKKISFKKFKDKLESNITKNLLKEISSLFIENINKRIKDDSFDEIINDSHLKLVKIINGEDKLSLIVKSKLSINIINKEILNFMYYNKTDKKINEYLTFEIK